MEEKKKDIQKDTLKPVTKVNSQLDKELQEWEVESTESGWWGKYSQIEHPSFRIALAIEKEDSKPFRNALDQKDV
jgi:hypothetical protein